jgi:hypothetical protein
MIKGLGMIYSKQGLLKYEEDLPELLKDKDKLPMSQHNRQAGDGLRKFNNLNLTKRDYRGMFFDGLVFDDTDFAYSDFTGATFFKYWKVYHLSIVLQEKQT